MGFGLKVEDVVGELTPLKTASLEAGDGGFSEAVEGGGDGGGDEFVVGVGEGDGARFFGWRVKLEERSLGSLPLGGKTVLESLK